MWDRAAYQIQFGYGRLVLVYQSFIFDNCDRLSAAVMECVLEMISLSTVAAVNGYLQGATIKTEHLKHQHLILLK